MPHRVLRRARTKNCSPRFLSRSLRKMRNFSGSHDVNGIRPSKLSLIVGMIILSILVVLLFSSKSPYANANYRAVICSQSSRQNPSIQGECHWYFLNYTPSSWESFWYENIKTLQENVCGNLANPEHLNKTIVLMQRLVALQKSGRNFDQSWRGSQ